LASLLFAGGIDFRDGIIGLRIDGHRWPADRRHHWPADSSSHQTTKSAPTASLDCSATAGNHDELDEPVHGGSPIRNYRP
jgi:hypothetical protein